MDMLDHLKQYHIILGSNSPRRKELLGGLNLPFETRIIADIDESYPAELPIHEIPLFIARQKAKAYLPDLASNELLITADTIVSCRDTVLGKPTDHEDAIGMLTALSGCSHEVITGVCISALKKEISFSVTSIVTFALLSEKEIRYYVEKYKPYDKAGAYGIQEWIGYIGVERINGSFYNVMGLPIQRLYQELKRL